MPRLARSCRRLPLFVRLLVALLWLFLVLYPDPSVAWRSVRHLRQLPVDPEAVAQLAQTLPDDPARIERIVLDEIVPYAYDWQVNGVPWYFPTTREVLATGRGDCESRALILASILEAKGIPHRLVMSLDHIWVDYPGKSQNALENDALAIAGQEADGGFSFGWPAEFDPVQELNDQLTILWVPMPLARKVVLFLGVLMALGWSAFAGQIGRRLGVPLGPAPRPARRGRRAWRGDEPRRSLDVPTGV